MINVLFFAKAEDMRLTVLLSIKTLVSIIVISLSLGTSILHAQTKESTGTKDDQITQINEVIQQCARAKLHFAYRQENLTAHYAIAVNNDLRASEAKITHPSGDKAFDQAVLNALAECAEYPETLRNSTFEGIFNYTR